MLAERFGGGPFVYLDAPADELARLVRMLSIEGEVASVYAGLGPDDEVLEYGPDGDEDD